MTFADEPRGLEPLIFFKWGYKKCPYWYLTYFHIVPYEDDDNVDDVDGPARYL